MKFIKILVTGSAIIALSTFIIFAQLRGTSKVDDTDSEKVAILDSEPQNSELSSDKGVVAPDKELMFFINPHGRPCQMQLSILDKMKDKLSGVAEVKYVKTTESNDRAIFYKYGIRSLPMLIVTDRSGKELKRFTPGIQDEKTIITVLNSIENSSD